MPNVQIPPGLSESEDVDHDQTQGGTEGNPHGDSAASGDVSSIQSSSDVSHDNTSGGTAGNPHSGSASTNHGNASHNAAFETETGAQDRVDSHENKNNPHSASADTNHGNAAHSSTFAVDGDAQPPQNHGNGAHTANYLDSADYNPEADTHSPPDKGGYNLRTSLNPSGGSSFTVSLNDRPTLIFIDNLTMVDVDITSFGMRFNNLSFDNNNHGYENSSTQQQRTGSVIFDAGVRGSDATVFESFYRVELYPRGTTTLVRSVSGQTQTDPTRVNAPGQTAGIFHGSSAQFTAEFFLTAPAFTIDSADVEVYD